MNKTTLKLTLAATLGVAAFGSRARAQLINVQTADFSATTNAGSLTNPGLDLANAGTDWYSLAGVGAPISSGGISYNVNDDSSGTPNGIYHGQSVVGFDGFASLSSPGYTTSGNPLDIGEFVLENSGATLPSNGVTFTYDITANNLVAEDDDYVDNMFTSGAQTLSLANFEFTLMPGSGGTENLFLDQLTFFPNTSYQYTWTPGPSGYPTLSPSEVVTLSNGSNQSIQTLLDFTFSQGQDPFLGVNSNSVWSILSTGNSIPIGLAASGSYNQNAAGAVLLGSIELNVTAPYSPAPEPSTYTLWGAALLVAVVAYRRMAAAKTSVSMV